MLTLCHLSLYTCDHARHLRSPVGLYPPVNPYSVEDSHRLVGPYPQLYDWTRLVTALPIHQPNV
jgi:hypothetical protein